MSMKIPTCQNDITSEWLKEVLKSSSSLATPSDKVEVDEIVTVEEKHGFISGVSKAKVKINDEMKKMFIKTIVNPDDPLRFVYDDNKYDETEIKFYQELLPDLVRFSEENGGEENLTKSLENMVAKLYSGDYCLEKEQRGFYLIMEDLSNQYGMKTGPEGLNFQQITDALVKIAKFHCTGYAYNMKRLKNPGQGKNWDLKSWCEKNINDSEFIGYMDTCFDSFIKDLEREDPDLAKAVKNLKKVWLKVYKDKINVDERFISHGDLWINNIMVNGSNMSKILDWQTLCPDHPVMDVSFLLCTSLTPENLENWTDDLIKSYVETFEETCSKFKLEMPFNLKEFHDMFFDSGVMLVFMFWMSAYDTTSLAYESTIRQTPHYKNRFMWQLKTCLKMSPELFE